MSPAEGMCARGHGDPDPPGSAWALSLPMGLDLMSHPGLQVMGAQTRGRAFADKQRGGREAKGAC